MSKNHFGEPTAPCRFMTTWLQFFTTTSLFLNKSQDSESDFDFYFIPMIALSHRLFYYHLTFSDILYNLIL